MTKLHPDEIDDKGNVVTLSPVKTDAQLAQELREEIGPYLAGVCRMLEKARVAGVRLEFQLLPDQFGRFNPPYVVVTKAL